MKISGSARSRKIKTAQICALALVVSATGLGGWVVSQVAAQDGDKISKFLLIKLSRDQSEVLCKEPAFTSCMEFSEQRCFEISEKALQQCIMPLPDTIALPDLNSKVLEECPQKVYADAGFSEDKAAACLHKVLNE